MSRSELKSTFAPGGNEWFKGVKSRAVCHSDRYTHIPTTDWEGVVDCFEMGEKLFAEAIDLLITVMDEKHIASDRPLGVVINEFLAKAKSDA